jgi:hypothetical protein
MCFIKLVPDYNVSLIDVFEIFYWQKSIIIIVNELNHEWVFNKHFNILNLKVY